jgi:hypothetical protein
VFQTYQKAFLSFITFHVSILINQTVLIVLSSYICVQSNEFFKLFLDKSMTYSCAVFKVCISSDYLMQLINFVE